jgi:RNA polymerase sigma-70 factor (ECF subfamily)
MSAPDQSPDKRPSWVELREAKDTDLLAFWHSGIDDAFAAIVDRYQRLVFSVAVRIVKDEAEAEDVVQIVFLDIFRDVGKFDASRGTLKVWLLQYAYSRSMNRRQHLECRQFYSKTDLDDLKPGDFSTRSAGGNSLSSSEVSRLLEQAFTQLSARQREAIDLIYFQGLKFSEAVHKTGETMSQLRHHYYRGLAKIRDFVESTRSRVKSKPAPASGSGIRLEVANVKPRAV